MNEITREHLVEELGVLRGVAEVGAKLYGCRGRQQVLDTVLAEARRLMRAEAGTLYLVQGRELRFVAVQNDRMCTSEIASHLMGKQIPLSEKSVAGFAATTGRVMNIPDARRVPDNSPYRIHRDLQVETGYDITSILAIPLNCPDGYCIGVLELFNRKGEAGEAGEPFPILGIGLMSLASSAAIALHNFDLQQKLRAVHLNTIYRLSAIAEYRDADTAEHIQRVSHTSELISRTLGLDEDQVERVKYASPMHDVGKVAIPDAILLKPGHLTESQRTVMQRHTVVGAEILGEPDDEVLQMAQQVALHHHERWDGEGYPRGLHGEGIPQVCRIVALADVFDAIVSRRCYKQACPLDVALDIIRKDSGKHFDESVVKAFLSVLDQVTVLYPTLTVAPGVLAPVAGEGEPA
jgi:HD-GYP domain-containing protein (c-di-GMP phosphodiesterase class II)